MCKKHRIPLEDRFYTPSLCAAHQRQAELQPTSDGALKPAQSSIKIATCPQCGQYFAFCCMHKHILRSGFPCHQTRVVHVDGATPNNGFPGAKSGLGIAYGTKRSCEFAIPVNDGIDSVGRRTSQRAELLAVLHALQILRKTDGDGADKSWHLPGLARHFRIPKWIAHTRPLPQDWLIVTDSEYTALGMTSRYAANAARGGVNASNQAPANADLMNKIDAFLREEESHGRRIGFSWVPREENQQADALAREGAQKAKSRD